MNNLVQQQPILTLGFSTMKGRSQDMIALLLELGTFEQIEILVVMQGGEEPLPPALNHVKLIVDTKMGISHSRNQVITNSAGCFIWFLDDDVWLDRNDIENLLAKLCKPDCPEVLRVQIGCIENHSKRYKAYGNNHQLSRLQLLQVSSIEVIVNRAFILKYQIRFNENFGLGTALPATEEVNFLLDIYRYQGVVVNLPKVFVYHSCCEQGRILANEGIFLARGATASRFGTLGLAIIFRWACRYFIRYRQLSYVKSLIQGYYQGYSAFTD
ncbi:glycosyltransferase family A protein [Thalassotalea sp. PS06]|uniref:glycosyltransferase family A protein n=1 Tax=Thalassotalea sp. PS06 TaxID=2594005 RepID=UPI001163FED9|nr:glycosyltransferase family A protein [Thalassotalea sp. PS06]QDP01788.1 glycosyltransferase family 2 protein [Thalassotalea sp. PS06]